MSKSAYVVTFHFEQRVVVNTRPYNEMRGIARSMACETLNHVLQQTNLEEYIVTVEADTKHPYPQPQDSATIKQKEALLENPVTDLPLTTASGQFQKAFFSLDFGPGFEGYSIKTQTWNGWQVPFFSAYIMQKLADELNREAKRTVMSCHGSHFVYYDDLNDIEEPAICTPVKIQIGTQILPLYCMGDWCWEFADTTENPIWISEKK